MPKYGEILRGLVFASTVEIFVQCHIQNPMQLIFDCPVFAHNFQNTLGVTSGVSNLNFWI